MNRNYIYQLFYEKLPNSLNDIMPSYTGCKIVTCLNPYYMIMLKPKDYPIYDNFDYICSDGMGPLKLNKLFGLEKSVRLSFDMSSMAEPVFKDSIAHKKGVFFLGAKEGEIDKSVITIKKSFPEINIVGYHHGYIKGREQEMVNEVIASGANICIVGMGAPLQDEIVVMLKNSGFVGTAYTCGGFIHQTQEGIISFPEWTNKLGIRWLYRIFTQRGMFKRLIQTYPKFVVSYTLFLRKKKKETKLK